MAKIAISLPDSLLRAVEKARGETGETRSEFLQRAARLAIKQEQERQIGERYIDGYLRFPESDSEEAAIVQGTAHYAFVENPWEDKESGAKR